MPTKSHKSSPVKAGDDGSTPSLLLDACERLRYDLLEFVASRASYGPPVFGPALLFLEDPREGVLRPATQVTWDDLRLAPLMDNLLTGCLARLSALHHGLSNERETGSEAISDYLLQYARNEPSALLIPGKLKEERRRELLDKAVNKSKEAFNKVVELMSNNTSQMLDLIFDEKKSEDAIEKLGNLAKDHLEPMLAPLARLRRASAIALGVSPETSLIDPDKIRNVVKKLLGIVRTRQKAWKDLQEKWRELCEKGQEKKFEEAIILAAHAIVQTEGEDALKKRLARFRELSSNSIEALRTAIKLFQVAPQEIGSSLAYLTLQYRNARSYLRGHLSYEHNLITNTYSHSQYKYPTEFVDEWPLYKITQRLERLFYGGHEHTSVISNITFIPVSYFPGQVIGQVVMSTPIEMDVPSLIDFSQYYIREIRTAATGEFISLIQRSLQRRKQDQRKQDQRIGNKDVLYAVAESLTTILSVQALLAFVRAKTAGGSADSYQPVYGEVRQGQYQPHDLINAYLNLKLPRSLKSVWPDKIPPNDNKEDLERYSFRQFLKDGLEVIVTANKMTQNPLKPLDQEAILLPLADLRHLDAFFDERRHERVFAISDATASSDTSKEGASESASQDLYRILRTITHAREDAHDSYLLLRLPLGDSGVEGITEEAILIARLWEPLSAVKNMTLSVLHTVWNGIRSCQALIDVADEAATVASTRDVAHTLVGPIGNAKTLLETKIIPKLESFPEDIQTDLKKLDRSLTDLHSRALGVKERWLRKVQSKPALELGKCNIHAVARQEIETEYFKSFWTRAEIELQITPPTSDPLVVRGSAEDWSEIFRILLKNAYEATGGFPKTGGDTVEAGSAKVELIFKPDQAIGGVITSLDIKIRNPGSLSDEIRDEMRACLENKRSYITLKRDKPDSLGSGLCIVGGILNSLGVTPKVASDAGMVEVSLLRIKVL